MRSSGAWAEQLSIPGGWATEPVPGVIVLTAGVRSRDRLADVLAAKLLSAGYAVLRIRAPQGGDSSTAALRAALRRLRATLGVEGRAVAAVGIEAACPAVLAAAGREAGLSAAVLVCSAAEPAPAAAKCDAGSLPLLVLGAGRDVAHRASTITAFLDHSLRPADAGSGAWAGHPAQGMLAASATPV